MNCKECVRHTEEMLIDCFEVRFCSVWRKRLDSFLIKSNEIDKFR